MKNNDTFKDQVTKISTDESLMETARHGSEAYPFHYYYENLALFDFNCVDWHWHSEFEFVYIESGNVEFNVGTDNFELTCGEGIMINSRVLHRMSSDDEAIIPNFLFHPSFIASSESLIYEKYVFPIISSQTKYVIFRPDIPWQAEALTIMKDIILLQDAESIDELLVSSYVQKLWSLIAGNGTFISQENVESSFKQNRLQLMMQYIHLNYDKDIDLEDISSSANISKSSALHLFSSNLKITPVNYLISYRLRQAALLLLNTEKKITAIAFETGFSSVDYFCRSFKKAYSLTPTEYRMRG